ncbi:MAG: glucose-6-phosphate isomerase [Planctomycetes bacterium]|nr:glucose-6-phosphate isomerase [Planctomycetota bacterium]
MEEYAVAANDSLLKLDGANCFEDRIGQEHGLRPEDLDKLQQRIASCHAELESRRGGDVGFMELPYDEELAARIVEKAGELRGWCHNFVVLGIGGSALGAIALHTALNHSFHNLLPAGHPGRKGAPRLFVMDNVDPALLSHFFDVIEDELPETAFNVITKSGSTAETMSQFLHVRELLRRRGADPARQIIATTDADPEKSILRRIAQREGFCTLPIPQNVGGRFSVLSAVGLLSAAVGGIDVRRLLAGAAAMDARCRSGDPRRNPAALYAALLYLFYGRGKPITVLMPYCHALRRLGDWYVQLWAESLGKRDGLETTDIFNGPTPVASVGVTDQHSTMQLYQDGRFDKVITLVEVQRVLPEGENLPIARGDCEDELSYLAGRGFEELFQAELSATRRALTDKSRPNLTLRIPEVSPWTLGEMFMFFEYAVAYSGSLYGVNTFDQPGVELGKQYTYGLMGREGYSAPAQP